MESASGRSPEPSPAVKKKDILPSLALGLWTSKFFSQGLSSHLYKENSDWDIQNLPDSQDCDFGANFIMLSQRWKDSGALLLLLSPFSGQSDQPPRRWPADRER